MKEKCLDAQGVSLYPVTHLHHALFLELCMKYHHRYCTYGVGYDLYLSIRFLSTYVTKYMYCIKLHCTLIIFVIQSDSELHILNTQGTEITSRKPWSYESLPYIQCRAAIMNQLLIRLLLIANYLVN